MSCRNKRASLTAVLVIGAAVAYALAAFGPAGRRGDVAAAPALTDSFGDGTPDFLRLDNPADREAFRIWTSFLAEGLFVRQDAGLPREIGDCAALVRFAYREALKQHDGRWASELALPRVPAAASVVKYHYPATPLGAGLFRVRPGSFTEADVSAGAFAEFADAETLLNLNAHRLGGDIEQALPGDLLFFHQPDQRFPFHVMMFLGPSQFTAGREAYLVYHTGPSGKDPGEIRRPSIEELKRHPDPRWHPVIGNSRFLGVFRWNILRD